MKNTEKYSAFETTVGKYSSRKIPQCRLSQNDLRDYIDQMDDETEE